MHDFEVDLACTGGRRPHPLRRLGKIVLREELNRDLHEHLGFSDGAAGPDVEVLQGRKRRGRAGQRTERFTAISIEQTRSGFLWVVRCPSCGREVRRHDSSVVQVVKMVIETGREELLDIGLWP